MLDLPTPILVGTLFPGLSLTATFCGASTASGESATTTKSCSGSWATFEAAAREQLVGHSWQLKCLRASLEIPLFLSPQMSAITLI